MDTEKRDESIATCDAFNPLLPVMEIETEILVAKSSSDGNVQTVKEETRVTATELEPESNSNIPNKELINEEFSKLTKKQQKKLIKKQRWEDSKIYRRQKTRRKAKEMKEKIKQGLVSKEDQLSRKQKQANLMKNSSCKVGIAIDMSFDDLMIEKDLAKCIKQIHRCYSLNRKQENPVQFYVTSYDGKAKEAMRKHIGWENWDVQFTNKPYFDLESYEKEKLVYLTSESDNVLTEVKDDHLYVIGGLVDHNSQKGLCHSLAQKNEVNHARLPISEHVLMKTRKVLTIDHVFEILVLVAQKTPWDDALMKVIAPRKLPQLKPETIKLELT